jgi:hypothetical protein
MPLDQKSKQSRGANLYLQTLTWHNFNYFSTIFKATGKVVILLSLEKEKENVIVS